MESEFSIRLNRVARPTFIKNRLKDAYQMTFRFATDSDLPFVAQMNRELLQDESLTSGLSECELLNRLARWVTEGHRLILFELEGEPVGYALFSFGERLGEKLVYLRHFFVKKRHRRKGYGRKAMEHLVGEVWPKSVPVYVDTRSDNTDALEFWKALHFDVFSLTFVRRAGKS